MGQLFQRLIDRDEAQAKRDDNQRDILFEMANRMGSLASAVEGNQIELARIVKLQESQSEYNSKLLVLTEQKAGHDDTFKRAFTELKEVATKLDNVTTKVSAYAGSLNLLKMLAGGALVVFMATGSFIYGTLVEKINDVRSDLSLQHATDKTAADLARSDLLGQIRDLQARARERDSRDNQDPQR